MKILTKMISHFNKPNRLVKFFDSCIINVILKQGVKGVIEGKASLTLSGFMASYEGASFLEDRRGVTRYSNGLEEGSEHESVWFCDTCETEAEDLDGDRWNCSCNH